MLKFKIKTILLFSITLITSCNEDNINRELPELCKVKKQKTFIGSIDEISIYSLECDLSLKDIQKYPQYPKQDKVNTFFWVKYTSLKKDDKKKIIEIVNDETENHNDEYFKVLKNELEYPNDDFLFSALYEPKRKGELGFFYKMNFYQSEKKILYKFEYLGH